MTSPSDFLEPYLVEDDMGCSPVAMDSSLPPLMEDMTREEWLAQVQAFLENPGGKTTSDDPGDILPLPPATIEPYILTVGEDGSVDVVRNPDY